MSERDMKDTKVRNKTFGHRRKQCLLLCLSVIISLETLREYVNGWVPAVSGGVSLARMWSAARTRTERATHR